MSEMERNKGKLIPFNMTEEVAEALVKAKGEDIDFDSYETYKEQVGDDYTWYDENLAFLNGQYYKVEWEVRCGDIDDFSEVTLNEDGTINFHTYHYNGGAHWSEVVEYALDDH